MINDNFKIIGGAERYFFNLVKLLKDRGHKVFTLTFADFESFKDNDFVLKQYQNKFGQFLAHRFISFRYFKIRIISYISFFSIVTICFFCFVFFIYYVYVFQNKIYISLA